MRAEGHALWLDIYIHHLCLLKWEQRGMHFAYVHHLCLLKWEPMGTHFRYVHHLCLLKWVWGRHAWHSQYDTPMSEMPHKWMENSLLTVGFCSLSIHWRGGERGKRRKKHPDFRAVKLQMTGIQSHACNRPTRIKEPSKKPHSVPSTMKWRCNDHPSARPILLLTPKLFSFFFFKKKSAGETDSLISLCAVWVDV